MRKIIVFGMLLFASSLYAGNINQDNFTLNGTWGFQGQVNVSSISFNQDGLSTYISSNPYRNITSGGANLSTVTYMTDLSTITYVRDLSTVTFGGGSGSTADDVNYSTFSYAFNCGEILEASTVSILALPIIDTITLIDCYEWKTGYISTSTTLVEHMFNLAFSSNSSTWQKIITSTDGWSLTGSTWSASFTPNVTTLVPPGQLAPVFPKISADTARNSNSVKIVIRYRKPGK